jgi:hypothetical protein
MAAAFVALSGGAVLADSEQVASGIAGVPPPTDIAQAGPAASQPAADVADAKALADRVDALEKENVVLREDLGKARLDARADLDAAEKRHAEDLAKARRDARADLDTAEKRHAEAIDRINQELADARAKLQAERAAQSRRNRRLWIAIGALAIGVIASD